MEIKIAENQTGHLMADLKIPKERCEELCNAIVDSIQELSLRAGGDSITQAQVIQHALQHARNDNEAVFLSITAGEYHAKYVAHVRGDIAGSLRDALASLHRHMAAHN